MKTAKEASVIIIVVVALLSVSPSALVFAQSDSTSHSASEKVSMQKGRDAFGKGDWDRAIAGFDEAIQINPNSHDAYYDRGIAYGRKGDYDRTIKDLSQAILLDPKDTSAYVFRSVAYMMKDDCAKAIAGFERAIQMDPKKVDADSYEAYATLLSICPQTNLRDGKKAVQYATKAYELSGSKSPKYMKTLAAACAEAGDFDNALKWQNQYLQSPNVSEDDKKSGQTRLALYQAHQAYHQEK
jgi:tetratricopeptide (TPR) repeat protein